MNPYPNLLSPKKVGSILFKNRIFTAPTGAHAPSMELGFQESIITHFANRAKGGPAMVMSCSGALTGTSVSTSASDFPKPGSSESNIWRMTRLPASSLAFSQ